MERRLVTILAADAVGYSRLVGEDEDGALARYNKYAAMMTDRIRAHSGRVSGGAGDSVIAEFPSPVEALRCALEIQHALAVEAQALADEQRMLFRDAEQFAREIGFEAVIDGWEPDVVWLRDVLDRESRRFLSRVEAVGGNVLSLAK